MNETTEIIEQRIWELANSFETPIEQEFVDGLVDLFIELHEELNEQEEDDDDC
jgi:hypothetical protein